MCTHFPPSLYGLRAYELPPAAHKLDPGTAKFEAQ